MAGRVSEHPLVQEAVRRGFSHINSSRVLRDLTTLYNTTSSDLTFAFCGEEFLQMVADADTSPYVADTRPRKLEGTAKKPRPSAVYVVDDDRDETVLASTQVRRAALSAVLLSGTLVGTHTLDTLFSRHLQDVYDIFKRTQRTGHNLEAPRRMDRQQQQSPPVFPPLAHQVAQSAPPAIAGTESMDTLALANLKVFGNAAFRPQQRAICEAVLSGRDVFVLMPTGGGKSLCYQLPAILSPGVTVVCSPLLSLIQDQVSALLKLNAGPGADGIPATFLSSAQRRSDYTAVLRELHKQTPSCKLLYVTPEQLVNGNSLNDALAKLASSGQLARFVIDEAHCVSAWGHSFRADYKMLGCLKERYPQVPILALTATATPRVLADTLKILRIAKVARIFKVTFNRPNLRFNVRPKVGGKAGLEAFAQHVAQDYPATASGIVYCLSRDECVAVTDALLEANVSATTYHAGMTPRQREHAQRDWCAGVFRVAVATIAFGMGIDKADVRFVLHWSMPKSVEGLYQEAGRAGRDGAAANHVVFYSPADAQRVIRLIRCDRRKGGTAVKGSTASQVALAGAVKQYCTNKNTCRRVQLLDYLGESGFDVQQCQGTCDNCARRLGTLSQGHDNPLPGATAKAAKKRKQTAIQTAEPDHGGKKAAPSKKSKSSAAADVVDLTGGNDKAKISKARASAGSKQVHAARSSVLAPPPPPPRTGHTMEVGDDDDFV